jgi:hypothetical protein
MNLLLVIIVAVLFAILVCLVVSLILYRHCFVRSRNKTPAVIVPVQYLPEIHFEIEEVQDERYKLSRRKRRKLRLRRFLGAFAQMQLQRQRDSADCMAQDDSDDDTDDDEGAYCLATLIRRIFQCLRTGSLQPPSTPRRRRKPWESDDDDNEEKQQHQQLEVKRAQRFISQDRLQRQAARQLMITKPVAEKQQCAELADNKVEEKTVAVLDLQEINAERVQCILDVKKERREASYKQILARGEVDHVKLNAGPTLEQIPKGYKLVADKPVTLNLDTLQYKRILYLWEGNKGIRPNGWFVATVVGISVKKGCNFSIKYDRKETKSLFVDGQHAVLLDFQGLSAYGRRWVLVEKLPAQEAVF